MSPLSSLPEIEGEHWRRGKLRRENAGRKTTDDGEPKKKLLLCFTSVMFRFVPKGDRSLNQDPPPGGSDHPDHMVGADEHGDMPGKTAAVLLFVLMGLLLSQLAETVLHRYHIYAVPGSGAVLVIGIISGAIVHASFGSDVEMTLMFDEHLFSLILLPIIIFQSGYALSLSHFFKRFGKILTFAFLGTVITTTFVGFSVFAISEADLIGPISFSLAESFAFAALISAIDPVATLCTFGCLKVEPNLAITVMGESVINDAVSLALYRAFEGFIVDGYEGPIALLRQLGVFVQLVSLSTIIGIIVGVLCAVQIKIVSQKMGMNCQASVILLWSYVSYAAAEATRSSGIIASVVCGIVMNHFCKKNFTKEQKAYINEVLLLLANFCDMCIFYLAGMSIAFYIGSADYSLLFWMVPICLIGRAINIFPLAAILNCNDKRDKIPLKEQVVMWHAGLRGAIAFSIALHFPDNNGLRDHVIDTTSMIILMSVFILGGTTSPLLNYLQIERGCKIDHDTHVKAVKDAVERSFIKSSLRKFDRNYLQPLLVKKKMRRDDSIVTPNTSGDSRDHATSTGFAEEDYDRHIREESEIGFPVKGGGGGITLAGSMSDRDDPDNGQSNFV